MYFFQNDVFVKTTFMYLMGLLFPKATFIYFLSLLHSTFISTYISTPHLFPLHIYYHTHLFPISHANERGVVIFRPTQLHKIEGRYGTMIGTPGF